MDAVVFLAEDAMPVRAAHSTCSKRWIVATALLAAIAVPARAAEPARPAPQSAPAPSQTPAQEAPAVTASLPIRVFGNVHLRYDFTRLEDCADLLLDGNQVDGLLTRLRFGLEFKDPNSTISGGLRFSAGETPNPASPFIRLGDAFRPVIFNLDQFYLDVRPFANKSRVHGVFGKMPQPFWRGDRGVIRAEATWDDDVEPGGRDRPGPALREGRRRAADHPAEHRRLLHRGVVPDGLVRGPRGGHVVVGRRAHAHGAARHAGRGLLPLAEPELGRPRAQLRAGPERLDAPRPERLPPALRVPGHERGARPGLRRLRLPRE